MKYISVMIIACVSTAFAGGCGKLTGREATLQDTRWEQKAGANPLGTWKKECDPSLPDGELQGYSIRFDNNRFYSETTYYDEGCKKVNFSEKAEGRFKVVGPAMNVKTTTDHNGIKVVPADAKNAYHLDIEISLLKFQYKEVPLQKDIFHEFCPSAKVNDTTREVEIEPKLCKKGSYREKVFLVYKSNGSAMEFATYLNIEGKTDDQVGSTKELRANVFPPGNPTYHLAPSESKPAAK